MHNALHIMHHMFHDAFYILCICVYIHVYACTNLSASRYSCPAEAAGVTAEVVFTVDAAAAAALKAGALLF